MTGPPSPVARLRQSSAHALVGTPPHVEASVQGLLEEARERPTQTLVRPRAARRARVRRRCSCSSPARCCCSCPRRGRSSAPTAVALTLLYAIASRVEFATGAGSTVPTQLVFVPMLFLLPTPAVPLFVAAGLLLGRLPRYLRGRHAAQPRHRRARRRALQRSARSSCCRLAGADTPSLGDWPIYVVALRRAVRRSTSRLLHRPLWLGLGAPPRLAARELGWICLADTLLSARRPARRASPTARSPTRTC